MNPAARQATMRATVTGTVHRSMDDSKNTHIASELPWKLKPGDRLKLMLDIYNKYNPDKISIHTYAGEMIGYLGKDIAVKVASHIDAGGKVDIFLIAVSCENKETYTCDIEIKLIVNP